MKRLVQVRTRWRTASNQSCYWWLKCTRRQKEYHLQHFTDLEDGLRRGIVVRPLQVRLTDLRYFRRKPVVLARCFIFPRPCDIPPMARAEPASIPSSRVTLLGHVWSSFATEVKWFLILKHRQWQFDRCRSWNSFTN